MKPSTIPKSNFRNKHIKWKVFSAVMLMWALLTAPLCIVEYIYIKNEFVAREKSEKSFQEKILAQTFEQSARYGDLINTKGNIESFGKIFGLQKILVCRDGKDIFGQTTNLECPETSTAHRLNLVGQNFNLYFLWSESTQNFHSLFVLIVFTSSILSLFLFVTIGSAVYLILVRKINLLARDIANVSTSDVAADLTSQLPELTPIVDSIYEMQQRIENNNQTLLRLKTNEALGILAKQVAHDIRSPLSALKILSQSNRNDSIEYESLIKNVVTRIEGIANSLLKQDSESKGILSFEINFNKFISNLVAIKNAEKFESHVQIKLLHSNVKADKLISIAISEDNLFRIASNIVNNAIESYDDQTNPKSVEIQINYNNENVTIIIGDKGKGIRPEILEKIENEGGSFGKEHLSDSGYGIGLSYIKSQMLTINGKIRILSAEGKGSSVELTIPAVKK